MHIGYFSRYVSNYCNANVFREDLRDALFPLLHELTTTPVSQQFLEASFNKLVKTITEVIEKHATLQTVSRKQKRF